MHRGHGNYTVSQSPEPISEPASLHLRRARNRGPSRSEPSLFGASR